MKDDLELSRTLTNIVALVEGVGDVFPSGTLAQAVTLTAVNAITSDDTDDAKVAVSRDELAQLDVVVTIGIASGYAAAAVLRAVGDILRAYLEGADPASPAPRIDVKVSRIEKEIASA